MHSLTPDEIAVLTAVARHAAANAYAPYSGFHVGAVVVADDDRVFAGCNVENASYGLGTCAERAAIAAAISAGVKKIRCIVVVTPGPAPSSPCGACLQWIAEFGTTETEVICAADVNAYRSYRLGDLLPVPFKI